MMSMEDLEQVLIREDSKIAGYPRHQSAIPEVVEQSGRYRLRFAQSLEDLQQIQRLRFEVFNLELGEGLNSSYATCRDEDEYDQFCHHMMVENVDTGELAGTYRMQTQEMAEAARGFYSATEFDLQPMNQTFLPHAVEIGRACIGIQHRSNRVLYLLWRGLAAYMLHNQKRYFFGCCSLTSQDVQEARTVSSHLVAKGYMDQTWQVLPQSTHQCYPADEVLPAAEGVKLPKLMQLYLDYGAKIASHAAIDRTFKTIDYLAIFDMEGIDARIRRMFVD